MRSHVSLPVVGVLVASLLVGGTLEVLAQRGGRGGGGRGGGGRSMGGGGRSMGGGGRSMGGMSGGMRSSARPSVSRPSGGGGFGGGGGVANRASSPTPPSSFGGGGGITNRPGGAGGVGGVGGVGGAGGVGGVGGVGGAGGVANRPGAANRPGGNDIGNRTNINTGDRNTNIETDGDWNGGSCWGGSCGCCHHPVAAGLAVGAAAAITAAAIGSTVYALPYGCQTVYVSGLTYNDCAGTWYQPQFVGTETTYIVVDPPQ